MGAMAYQFKEGFRFENVNPQKAGERIEKIRARTNGLLTPEHVVEDARSVRSPLHNAFEWNDTVAAEKYRLDQASYLIRAIIVVPQGETSDRPPLRAFVNVKKDEQRGYTSLDVAMSDSDLRAQVVQQAWSELLGWRERYREYQELAKVFSVIDTASGDRAA